MEINTILLSLKEYNELRDFKTEVLKEKKIVCTVHTKSGFYGDNYYYNDDEKITFYKPDDALETLYTLNKTLEEENKSLRTKCMELNTKLSSFKKLSIWEFLKWRKK